MPLMKPFSKSSEKQDELASVKDHSPPPAYTANAPDNGAAPDITAAFSNLNLQESTKPTVDQCIAHLKLLEAFNSLREDVATTNGLFGIKDDFANGDTDQERVQSLTQIREKRWAVYVSKSADRFAKWWQFSVEPDAQKLEQRNIVEQFKVSPRHGAGLAFNRDNLPPLDVIMVWHAYQLNPRDFLEDCLRHGKMDFWRTGLPWSVINSCIDNETFEFRVSGDAAISFQTQTGHEWNSLDDRDEAIFQCPMCLKPTTAPWTTWTKPYMWKKGPSGELDGEVSGNGFADKDFRGDCINIHCKYDIRHDDLKISKFRNDMLALYNRDVPMPGTALTLDGIPAVPHNVTRADNLFPNRLLGVKGVERGQLHYKLLSASTPAKGTHKTMSGVRKEIEQSFTDRNYIKRINNAYTSVIQRTERIHVRRMMSHYWDNSSIFGIDLASAVIRQASFIEKMHSIDWIHSPAAGSTMQRLITKYERYINIIATYPNQVAVPTLDVDLAWHTHQLSPPSYYSYTKTETGKFIDHDDKIEETALSTAFEWTSKTYQKKFGELYSECTCWYCEAIRESHTSSLKRALTSKNTPIDDQLDKLHTSQDATFGPHISSHNAIPAKTANVPHSARTSTLQYKLERDYQKAVKRARKRGHNPPEREKYTYMGAYGYPIYMPYYAPYMGDPCVTGGMYPANPACATFVPGAAGNCCAGACGGGVAAGGCAGGAGAGGACAGGAAGGGGGGGFGGCGGGGGGCGGGGGGCGGGGGGGC